MAKTFLDIFIDANILILIAFFLWSLIRAAMMRSPLERAYATQLGLLNAMFLVVLAGPLIVALFGSLQQAGIAKSLSLNLSDRIVAYYLNGGFEMKASELETIVSARDTFVHNIASGRGWLAQTSIALFVLGCSIGVVRFGCSVACLARIVGRSYAWRRIGRVHIRLSDRTLVPFSTRGMRRYYIVLPTHMVTEPTELRVSLAHEIQHIRQGDLEWEILLELLKPLFFLNPVFHAWKKQVEHLRELNCDAAVLTRGRVDTRAYCATLLSVCQKALQRDRAFVSAVPKVTLVTADRSRWRKGRRSFLETRLRSVLDGKTIRHERLFFAATALPLVIVLVVATLAIQRPGDWSHDRLMLSTVVNLERLDEITRHAPFRASGR